MEQFRTMNKFKKSTLSVCACSKMNNISSDHSTGISAVSGEQIKGLKEMFNSIDKEEFVLQLCT